MILRYCFSGHSNSLAFVAYLKLTKEDWELGESSFAELFSKA